MRHLVGLAVGIVLTLLVAGLPAWSYQQAAELAGTARTLQDLRPDVLPAIVAMAAAGFALGLVLAARRVSPLALLVPALAYLGVTGAYIAAPLTVLSYVPEGELYGIGVAFLGSGIYALLGMALLVPALIPGRWRRPAREPEAARGASSAFLFEPAGRQEPQADDTAPLGPPERQEQRTQPIRWDEAATMPLRDDQGGLRGGPPPPPAAP